ncbi:MAG: SusC/RagA family TonB-linked outer membrane protein [Flavobacterium sp.]
MKSKFTWIFTLLLAFSIQLSFAQERTISGIVTDANGMPIPSVTVQVEGTTGGVQTDFDGKYAISASTGQKLVFSYVGLSTQIITVGASNTVSVQMAEDVKVLGQVVVEGYGTSRIKERSNVAVTTVGAETLENRPNANFIQSLQGQVAGLNILTGSGQPGSNSSVILRGRGSINGNIEPLYIIDGMQLTVDNFRSINPNDIESISVLKDAGATAIYGNRGANGAIIITTRKGAIDSDLAIRYSSVTGFTTLQDNKYRKMNTRELLKLEQTAGRGFGSFLTDAEINAYPVDTDWYDELFRTGISHSHQLSLSGGSKNSTSYTSLNYFEQEGIVQGTDLKRFSFRNNMTGKTSNDRFNYSTNMTINFSRRNEASNLGQGSVNINPLVGANNGAPYIDPSLYRNGTDLHAWYTGDETNDPAYVPVYGDPSIANGTLFLSPLMLLDRIATGTLRTDELKMIGSGSASFKITDDLTIGSTLGIDYTQATSLNVQDPLSFNSLLFRGAGEEFLGFQTEGFSRDVNFYVNTRLAYNKTIAEKHTLEVAAYTEYNKSHLKSFSYTQEGLDPKVFEPGAGNGFIGFNDATSPFYVPTVASGKATAGLFSYFANLDYDYDSRFGLGATVRRDASYRFNDSNRWGTFWSVSGRWNIDKESFMENSVINMLKLRASYGKTGNQNIVGQSMYNLPNAGRSLYDQGTGYANAPAYVLSQIGNDDLSWEDLYQFNVGLDFQVWNSRLRGTVDYYRKVTDRLYLTRNISAINGTTTLDANFGSLENEGVEAQISYDILRSATNDYTITLNANGSYNKNRLRDIYSPTGMQDNVTTVLQEGHVLDEYFLIRYAGVNPANGNLLFYDINGALTENPNQTDDRVYTDKSFIPVWQGGFGLDADYKGFFLQSQFAFVADVWRFDSDLESLQDPSDIGVFNKSTDLQRAWTPDNRVTDIPSLTATNLANAANSDRYLKDASYLRLKFVSLGYSFPKSFLDQTFMSRLRAYVQGENLVTWSKWRGWDADSTRSQDVYNYPTPRIISVGLEVEF